MYDAIVERRAVLCYLLSSFFWVIESCGPELINAGVELIEELLEGFSGQNLIGRLAGIASDLLDYALDAFSTVIDALVDAVPRLVELIVPALTDAVTQISDNLSALAPQLANAAMQLFSALGEALPAEGSTCRRPRNGQLQKTEGGWRTACHLHRREQGGGGTDR